MRSVDVRSDTITRPTPAMRRAMADAEVGDDVFGEDPTVNRLEAMAAELIGKEAAMFAPSGTMANLICQLSHCGRGDEMILGDQAHIFFYEQGGSAAVGGIHPRTLPNRPDGTISIREIEAAVRPDNVHFPRTRLIAIENTHNRCNGTPLDATYMDAVGEKAHSLGVKLHVDGARIFNAAAALGTTARRLAEHVDSISFCLSKGLAAPVGSMVCGGGDFIARARRARKVLGGGMRQAGVLAAAGIVALSEMIDRLGEDHGNARRLAEGLAEIKGVRIDPAAVKTNIVFFETPDVDAEEIAGALDAEGVRVLPSGPRQMRAVTHYHITPDDIEYVLSAMSKVFKNI
ncbi:MAG: low-specificity L-threonine aldolase [Desulfobacterales bacterium]|nr:low-specificity L-threonine aldolase [Desulfobacterales bacterium]